MKKLLRFDEEQLYCLWDVETCHLNLLDENLPWQIGFIIFNKNEILEKHHYYIWHENLKMSKDAIYITRFNEGFYKKNAKPQKEILDLFESYLYNDKYINVGHNVCGFDNYVHLQWRRLNGLRADWSYLQRTLDTKCLSAAYKLGIKKISRDNWLSLMFRLSDFARKGLKTNLGLMGREFGIDYDYDSLHDGLNDCILNYHIFKQLIIRIDI